MPTGVTPYHEEAFYGGMMPHGDAGGADGPGSDPMLSPENQSDFDQIEDWWHQARAVLSAARYEMALDDDFYDGLQWAEQDQLEVEDRGQAAMVFNQIKPVVDWILGTERRARAQWRVLPRTDDDRKLAEVKTKAMKYTDDISHTGFHRSRAFGDAVRVGLGWLEDGVRADPRDEPIFSRYESWRNMWWDHLAQEQDYSDARYLFRSRWVDEDIGCAMFPEYKDAIRNAARTHDIFGGTEEDDTLDVQLYYRTDEQGRPMPSRTYVEDASFVLQNRRSRVRLVECWYRKPKKRRVLRVHDVRAKGYSAMNGMRVDNDDQLEPRAQAMVEEGIASIYDAIVLETWCAIFVDGTLLQNQASPYRHDRFPFTPIWGYRRKRDGAPYGVIRNMRDPQEDMNKRRSKALHALSSVLVIAEERAVEDEDEARDEVARPDGWVTVRRDKRFEIVRDDRQVAMNVDLELQNREYIRETGGVTSENLGHETNASSGKAIQARQNEGAVVTTELFDNYHFAFQLQGEKRLSLIEQFKTAPEIIRLVSDRGAMEFHVINDVTGLDANGEPIVENDIAATKADFILDREDFRSTMREAMFEQLFDMMSKLMSMGEAGAQAAWNMLDLVVDMWDGPGKEAMVARIRKLNGQPDPSQEGTPEAEQARQAKEQEEAAMRELEQRRMMAEVEQAEGTAQEKRAGAALKKQQAAAQTLQMLQGGLEVGQQLLITPEVAAMIDEVMDFVNEQAATPAEGAQPQQPQPPQQPMAPPDQVPPGAM